MYVIFRKHGYGLLMVVFLTICHYSEGKDGKLMKRGVPNLYECIVKTCLARDRVKCNGKGKNLYRSILLRLISFSCIFYVYQSIDILNKYLLESVSICLCILSIIFVLYRFLSKGGIYRSSHINKHNLE